MRRLVLRLGASAGVRPVHQPGAQTPQTRLDQPPAELECQLQLERGPRQVAVLVPLGARTSDPQFPAWAGRLRKEPQPRPAWLLQALFWPAPPAADPSSVGWHVPQWKHQPSHPPSAARVALQWLRALLPALKHASPLETPPALMPRLARWVQLVYQPGAQAAMDQSLSELKWQLQLEHVARLVPPGAERPSGPQLRQWAQWPRKEAPLWPAGRLQRQKAAPTLPQALAAFRVSVP
mmetsp:Transcript_44920/g.128294  ORF Transcript_44920/g.128294 Transcript_44920/m.128294 type:complete len:236 (+) Transcript_44920:320-1027(+)